MKPGFTIEDSTTNDLLNTDSIHKEKYFRLKPAVALYHCPTPLHLLPLAIPSSALLEYFDVHGLFNHISALTAYRLCHFQVR